MPWNPPSILILLFLFCASAIHAKTLEQIEKIQTAPAHDLPDLWEQHGRTDEFRFLVMQRWLEVAPESFFKLPLNSEDFTHAWWLRGRAAAQSGKELPDTQSMIQKYSGDLSVPYFLGGFASERPNVIAEFVKKEDRLQPKHVKEVITRGLVIGWAKYAPKKAVALIEQNSPFDWKSPSPAWLRDGSSISVNPAHSAHDSFALSRWIAFHPEEALAVLFEEKDVTLHQFYISVLAQKFPEKLKEFVDQLPTGTKKRTILAGMESVDKSLEEIRRFSTLAPPAQTRSDYSFPKLLERASQAPQAEFPSWLTDLRMAHLEPVEITMVRSVIRERWEALDPEALVRFQAKHGQSRSIMGLGAWWRKDPKEATDFVLKSDASDLWEQLLVEMGSEDPGEALALYSKKPEFTIRDPRAFLASIAAQDRDQFLAFALKDESRKAELLPLLAWIRMSSDFDWVVETMNRHKVNPFEGMVISPELTIPHFTRVNSGEAIFDLLHRMPDDWKSRFLENESYARGDAIRWLSVEKHPALSEEQLKSLQKSLANEPYWIDREDVPMIMKLVEQAHWLSHQIKNQLAHMAMIRDRDRERHREWVLSLPPEINSEALEALNYFRDRAARDAQFAREKVITPSTARTLSEIQDGMIRGRRLNMERWTGPELQNLHDELKALNPDAAAKLYSTADTTQFPWRLRATLIQKILAAETISPNGPIRTLIKETAKDYASHEPALASKWAMSFPHDDLRSFAAGFVAAEWKKQNPAEAEIWVKTLPEPMQKRFGY